VKNSLDGGFAFAGYQSDMKCGYFDFSEYKLMFKSIQGGYKGRETSTSGTPILFQWPITHHEAQLQQVDGKTINKEIDDDRQPWFEKKNFVVDFAAADVTEESVFGSSECWKPLSRRRLDNSVQTEPGYISFVVEVLYERACPSAKSYVNGYTNYMVQYRYSFKKREENKGYVPMAYAGELDPKMRKFGYFQSIKEELNDQTGLAKNIFLVNRWDPNKEHNFFFTKDFPEKYKYIFYDIFEKTNNLFAKNGLKVRFHLYENNGVDGKVKELGDLRYSFINLVEIMDPSAPLGYGPSDADPFTGEIIAANLNVWSAMLKYYLKVLEQSSNRQEKWAYDPVKQEWFIEKDPSGKAKDKWSQSTLFSRMQYYVDDLQINPASFASQWGVDSEMSQFFQKMADHQTYGFPGWNLFTKEPSVNATYVLVERPQRPEENSPSAMDYVSSPLKKGVDIEKLFNIDIAQVKFLQPRVLNYVPFLERPVFKANAQKSIFRNPMDSNVLAEIDEQFAQLEKDAHLDISRNVRGHCRISLEETLAGVDRSILSGFTTDQIVETILYRTSIHEFGHNLNLRHNFYGSLDKRNFPAPSIAKNFAELQLDANGNIELDKDTGKPIQTGKLLPVLENGKQVLWPAVSSSVMDYMRLQDEYYSEQNWEPYDEAALLYAYSGGKIDRGFFLFCTDEHTLANALCNRFDKGTTPTEVVMSFVESYEDSYYTRNYRFERPYWDTSGYMGAIFGQFREVKEFLPMWRTAFYDANMQEVLGKMGKNKFESKELSEKMQREIKQAVKLSIAFFQAVLEQSNAEKPFRSIYEKGVGSGALKRMGIASDKLLAMYFLAGDDQMFYNPNLIMNDTSYISYMYAPGLNEMMKKVVQNIVTQRVDMEPWFISFGRALYVQSVTNFTNREDHSMINNLRVQKYTADELKRLFNISVNEDPNNKTAAVDIPKDRAFVELKLKQSTDASFKVGETVIVATYINGNYYMFSKDSAPFAYEIARDLVNTEGMDNAIVEGLLDLQELYQIYNVVTGGSF
ncbi:hypothetical protein K2X05_14325, partial [bacterium]|nr:hypothetical protein [bacterium]